MSISKTLLKGAALRTSTVMRPSVGAGAVAPVASVAPASATQLSTSPGQSITSAAPAPAPVMVPPGELERLREKAREEGLALGRQQAKAEADKTVRDKLAEISRLMTSLSQAFETECHRIEDQLVDFAFVATCRVVGHTLQDRDSVVSLVRQALQACEPWNDMTLELNPRDLETVNLALSQDDAVGEHRSVRCMASASVTLGGCRAATSHGVLDARLEVQLAQLRASLDAARES